MNSSSDVLILKQIAEFLNEETELESMLQGALSQLLKGTDFQTGWIFFIGENGRHALLAQSNLPKALNEDDCHAMRAGGCWCVNKYKRGELEKASNILECKRIVNAIDKKHEGTDGITHHATVTLQSGTERFGLLNVATPGRKKFTEQELILLESAAFQIGSAIKRIQLTKKEQEVALIQERNRLARDLHDSVNQLLFSITLTARGGAEMTDQQEVKETFHGLQSLAQEALTEMRALIWQLRPKGLEGGIKEAVNGYGEILGLKINFNQNGVAALPSKVEETIFRVAQEALTNCKRHAAADEVTISISTASDRISMSIEDKGCGFNTKHLKALPSVGVKSMRERVELAGGEFMIKSSPGKGTVIKAEIPF
nr:GAF domain-containing sensor histidine kinase [Jeotgalibacillus proteolyticus]